MRMRTCYMIVLLTILVSPAFYAFKKGAAADERFISYTVNPARQPLRLYWKDDRGHILGSLARLKAYAASRHRQLIFAMNGGMYREDQSPLGLYIENFKVLHQVNHASGNGNFYLKPNGVFGITGRNEAVIFKTEELQLHKDLKYATQSGPMLVINGAIHPAFTEGSENVHIRNGVGILPDHTVLFAISRQPVNLYDFAAYFKAKGCRNALYLDGFVSRMYLPARQVAQTDGSFGVMIGVTAP